ncbi:DNA phosphorothioation-associated putative methyltransferase [uncultured Thiodictyon sp.]|uniref:DNA phosphorothioation-associated putative methyltransferase n=1 Tax=uncultured Thiodictyon sp. TaxID=1846217 RepID=UPI0025E7943D|nr:DNA phosphorothioation-associated putative methyltransferase [uncultured Thiodictyon sp.]
MTGKTVAQRTYLHISGLGAADAALAAIVAAAEAQAGVRRGEAFNVVRLDPAARQVALLHYPGFFDDPFPALQASWRVDLSTGEVGYRAYTDSQNPPILHRKELMLAADDPRRETFAGLTQACESIGLFDEPTRIGYRRQWLDLVRERGYQVVGHALLPLGNDESGGEDADPRSDTPQVPAEALAPTGPAAHWAAARQLTALVRYGFSAPVQTLARHGLLETLGTDGPPGRLVLFDYGCGRGDDVRGLIELGIQAAGWDPYYAPENPIHPAPIVNLGFVINVIEDPQERLTALGRAWSLTQTLLVVSVMLSNQSAARGTDFNDGVLTQRRTFQRQFTQTEVRAYLAEALEEEPIAVAPGVHYVFRDKEAEQRFLAARCRSRRHTGLPPPASRHPPAPTSAGGPDRYAAYREPLGRLWERWLALAHRPEADEVGADLATLTEGFGSLAKALRFLADREDPQPLARAEAARRADLLVYLALNLFERRRPYTQLEPELQRAIKALFGDYATAQAQARALLFSIRDTQGIADICREAAEHGLGWLDPGRSLQLHTSLVERLPPLLRVYVGAAAALYGDTKGADLVKIHIGSGKLSLMRYDDFMGLAVPRLLERVKVRLRDQECDWYLYGETFAPPWLFHKSRFINEEFPNYPEQVAFEEALDALGLFDFAGFGPPPGVFAATLARHRWVIDGLRLRRSDTCPELDDRCGRFLTFRQLIACGETQARTGLPNLPRQAASWNALQDLAERVLDPVIDWFGMIRLTYAFCSPELAREITGRTDPKLDQHAAHEHNRLGNAICPRHGAAVDFIVEDEDMAEVARWLAENTPFDRLYFYGADQPIHVSYGPEHNRQVVRMVPTAAGRLVPRVIAAAEL